ncbi:hypothetical protein Bca101_044817 [Brassica carinata]
MDPSSQPFEDTVNRDVEEEFQTPDSARRGKRKQSEDDSQEQSNTKRVLPTRSDVWEHYQRSEENRDKCVCNYCLKSYTCPTKSGTTNLRNHLKCCKQFKAWQDGQDLTKSQQKITKEGLLKSAKVSEDVFKEAANEMVVISQLPLSFVESVGFKHFCNKTNLPNSHSRRTATRDIVKMYVKRKAALKKKFQANKQRVSITTDIWVSQVTSK